MAGIRTDLHEWAEKNGGWVLPVTLEDEAREEVERILGRELTQLEIAELEKNLAHIRYMRTGFPEPTLQSMRRTLKAISEMPPNEAVAAFLKCDEATRASIEEVVCDIDPHSLEQYPHNLSGESIAKAALKGCLVAKNGAPYKRHHPYLAQYAISLWEQLGQSDWRAWEYDDSPKPLVEFMTILAWIVDDNDKPMNTTSAARLIRSQKLKEGR